MISDHDIRNRIYPEIIEDGITGLLYQPGDADALVEKICWACDHRDEAKEIAQRGQQRARRYTVEANASAVKKVYSQLLDEQGGSL